MKRRNIILISILGAAVILLGLAACLLSGRVFTPTCPMAGDGASLYFGGATYTRDNTLPTYTEQDVGRVVAIGEEGRRTLTDFIWPNWIMEFKNDKGHEHLLLRGLMYECTYTKNK